MQSYNFENSLIADSLAEVRSRRAAAEGVADERRLSLSTEYPDFRSIDREFRSTGSQIYEILQSGGDIEAKMSALKNRNLRLQKDRREFLQSLGLPQDYLTPAYICSDCSDSGYRGSDLCHCVLELCSAKSAARLNDSSPLSLSSFDSFNLELIPEDSRKHMRQVYKFLRSWCADFSRTSPSLFFYGDTGLGKTHLSLSAAAEVIARGYSVIYGSAQNFFTSITDERFDRGEKGTEERILECDLLILDDLGAEYITQFTQSILYNILNSRILSKKPTVISSNIGLEHLDEYYHPRIVSRIAYSFDVVPFVGRDIRQIIKTENVNGRKSS